MGQETNRVVTLKGSPVTLLGRELKVGDKAPDFLVLESLNEEISLDTFRNKTKIFNVVVSVDTPVCDTQTKKFNKEASYLPQDVEVITVSMDLPFALNRYRAAEGIDKVHTVSDHRDASFGEAYGVLIKEYRLLTRAIFVVDKEDVLRYVEYVNEITNEPSYESVLSTVKELSHG